MGSSEKNGPYICLGRLVQVRVRLALYWTIYAYRCGPLDPSSKEQTSHTRTHGCAHFAAYMAGPFFSLDLTKVVHVKVLYRSPSVPLCWLL